MIACWKHMRIHVYACVCVYVCRTRCLHLCFVCAHVGRPCTRVQCRCCVLGSWQPSQASRTCSSLAVQVQTRLSTSV